MKGENHYIIRSLDNPARFLFWEIDVFGIVVVPFLVGILAGSFLMMGSGLVMGFFYKRLKKKFPNNSFKQKLYWHLPTDRLKGFVHKYPPSHIRELIL